jgi:hypothetical protein
MMMLLSATQLSSSRLSIRKALPVPYYPPYAPDWAPAGYFLFPKVKSHLVGRRFDITVNSQNNVTSELKGIPAAEICGGIQKLYDRASRHIELGGDECCRLRSNKVLS